MSKEVTTLPSGRIVHLYHHDTGNPKPWDDGYSRVIVPYTEEELKNRKNIRDGRNMKKAHIQIAANANLKTSII